MFRPWEKAAPSTAQNEVADADMEVQIEENKRNRRYLTQDAKEIIKNVYNFLIKKECSAPLKVTSEMVGVPYTTVRDIIENKGNSRKSRNSEKFLNISKELGIEIKKVIYQMYKENKVPTTASLKLKLLELGYDISYCEEWFRKYLRSIGFNYSTLNQRLSIMESTRLKRMRWDYINEIRRYRQENRNIVYLDETWYDTHDLIKKGLTDGTNNCVLQAPPSTGKRIIILHAGGSDGWVENGLLLSAKQIQNCSADYHCDMDSALFETWFQQQLLPGLPPGSVIVMDNASYHSKLMNKAPTSATKK